MRECEGTYVVLNPDTEKYEIKEFESGWFYGIGVDYEEFECGPGMYSTAIVELPDGKVINPPIQNIRFKKPYPTALKRERRR